MNNKDADQTVQMHSLICTFVVYHLNKQVLWEGSGSVVECLTRDREATGSSVTALLFLSKTHLS